MERANGLRVVSASSPALLATLEAAVRAGLPVLVEDTGEALDPLLDPLLLKATYKHGEEGSSSSRLLSTPQMQDHASYGKGRAVGGKVHCSILGRACFM